MNNHEYIEEHIYIVHIFAYTILRSGLNLFCLAHCPKVRTSVYRTARQPPKLRRERRPSGCGELVGVFGLIRRD